MIFFFINTFYKYKTCPSPFKAGNQTFLSGSLPFLWSHAIQEFAPAMTNQRLLLFLGILYKLQIVALPLRI